MPDNNVMERAMKTPSIVSAAEWEAAGQQLLVKEKELTRARNSMAYRWWIWHDEPRGTAAT